MQRLPRWIHVCNFAIILVVILTWVAKGTNNPLSSDHNRAT